MRKFSSQRPSLVTRPFLFVTVEIFFIEILVMSHKRSASSGPAQRKRRTVNVITEERRERLQLMALVPDDVLRSILIPMVCWTDAVQMVPTLLALGEPCSDIVFSGELFPEKVFSEMKVTCNLSNRIFEFVSSHPYDIPVVKWLRKIKASAPEHLVARLCKDLRTRMGPLAHARSRRVLVTAVLDPTHTNADVKKCDENHAALCLMMSKGVDSPSFTVAHAMNYELWDLAAVALESPYSMKYDLTRFRRDLGDVPPALVRRIIDLTEHDHTQLCVMLANTYKGSAFLAHMVEQHAAEINGDEVLRLYTPRLGAGPCSAFISILPRIRTTPKGRADALVVAHLVDRYVYLIAPLQALGYDTRAVASGLISRGRLDVAEDYVAKIDNPDDVIELMRGYCPSINGQFLADQAVVRRIPGLRAIISQVPFIDNAITRCPELTVAACIRALDLGADVLNITRTLANALNYGRADLAQWILGRPGALTAEHVTRAVTIVLHEPLNGATLTPALETGLVDQRQLIVAMANRRSLYRSRILDQVADYYSK